MSKPNVISGGVIRPEVTDPSAAVDVPIPPDPGGGGGGGGSGGGGSGDGPGVPGSGITAAIPIEIIACYTFWDNVNTSYRAFQVHLDPTEWNGIRRARFEVHAEIHTSMQNGVKIQLVDEEDTVHAEIVFPPLVGFATGYHAVRKEIEWVFDEEHDYTVRLLANPLNGTSTVGIGRIWFDLENSTKFLVQRPMVIGGQSFPGFMDTGEENDTFAWSFDYFTTQNTYQHTHAANQGDMASLWKRNDAAFATVAEYRLSVNAWSMVFTTGVRTKGGSSHVALFNYDTGQMVSGSEQEWVYSEQEVVTDSTGQFQAVPITKTIALTGTETNFADQAQFEFKAKNNNTGTDYGLFVISRADLWIKLQPATKAEIYMVALHLHGQNSFINYFPTALFPNSTFSFELSKRKVTGTAPFFGIQVSGSDTWKLGNSVNITTGMYYGGFAGHEQLINGGSNWEAAASFLPPPTVSMGAPGWRLPGTAPIASFYGAVVDETNTVVGLGSIFYPMGSATVGAALWTPNTLGFQTAEVTLNGFIFDRVIDPTEVISRVTFEMTCGWPAPPISNRGTLSNVSLVMNARVGGTDLADHSLSLPYTLARVTQNPITILYPFAIRSINITSDRSWVYSDFTTSAFKAHIEITNPNTSSTEPLEVVLFIDGTLTSFRPRVIIETTAACDPFLTINQAIRSILRVDLNDGPLTTITDVLRFRICFNVDQFTIAFIVASVSGPAVPSMLIAACPTVMPQVGIPYSFPFEVSGGTAPYQWELVSGEFPPGLVLNGETGVLSGTATEFEGTYEFTVMVTDFNGNIAVVTCELSHTTTVPNISAACPITQPEFGVPYELTLSAIGGTLPYTWSIIAGALPLGLTLNSTTGVISGTPIVSGNYSYTVRVTDALGFTSDATCSGSGPTGGMIIPCFCDTDTGVIYEMSNDIYDDAGCAIRRVRRSPHISDEMAYFFYDVLQVDMETGVGLNSGQGEDPQVMMRFSDDGGRTWSNETWRTAGRLGEFSRRVTWRQLGRGRDRIFEIVITDPVKIALVDGYLKLRKGRN